MPDNNIHAGGTPGAWVVRSEFTNGSVMKDYLQDNIVSVEYNDCPSFENLTREEIKAVIAERHPHFTSRQIELHTNTPLRMASEAREGDYLVVSDGDHVYFAKVTGRYYFDADLQSKGLAHRQPVEWLKGPLRRSMLPEVIRVSLRAPVSYSCIDHIAKEITDFLSETGTRKHDAPDANLRSFAYPLRLEQNAIIQIPEDCTQNELVRLADFVRTLYFTE